jgi:hypothetical protein
MFVNNSINNVISAFTSCHLSTCKPHYCTCTHIARWCTKYSRTLEQRCAFKFSVKLIFTEDMGFTIFPKMYEPPQILGATRVTWSKFHTEGPQTLGTTIQNSNAQVTWQLKLCTPAQDFTRVQLMSDTRLTAWVYKQLTASARDSDLPHGCKQWSIIWTLMKFLCAKSCKCCPHVISARKIIHRNIYFPKESTRLSSKHKMPCQTLKTLIHKLYIFLAYSTSGILFRTNETWP